MANRAVFLDRDGTMAPDVHYCSRPEDFELFPNTAKAVRLLNEHGFKVIVITNQSGIARGYFTEKTLAEIHEKMKRELAKEGARVDAIYYCPHHPDDNCDCRKPKPKLILQAAKDFDIDLERSFVMGDLQMDIDLGKAACCPAILIRDGAVADSTSAEAGLIAPNLLEATRVVIDGELDKMCKGKAWGSTSVSR
jgi:histidinol-phosphate phosphatase family protein